jgi:phage-related baseplate assembly protein
MNLFGLSDISFAEKDPDAIKRDIISSYESAYNAATGELVTLHPGDPRRLFLLTVADMIILQRNIIDWTAKQNLLAFSTEGNLDHLGLQLDVRRLPSQHSRTTVRFTLSAPQTNSVIIPAGTRITPGGGSVYFATEEPLDIPPGDLSGNVLALAVLPGEEANGFLPGQINRLVDPLPWVQSVTNLTASSGGADVEDDENLRERIHLAPESFSVAGPRGAYEFWARSSHPGIIDAAVVGPPILEPGYVEIYPLLKGGELPTQDILDLVYDTCNADDVRPLTDHLSVLSPVATPYSIVMEYWLDRRDATIAGAIQSGVKKAVDEWILWQKSEMGRDITPSRLTQMVMDAGVKRVEITSPAYTVLNYKQIAISQGEPSIIYGGMEDG